MPAEAHVGNSPSTSLVAQIMPGMVDMSGPAAQMRLSKGERASEVEHVTPQVQISNIDSADTPEGVANVEDDPHRAALQDDVRQKLPAKTWAAVFFLGFTFQPALAFSILGVFPIISVIATEIQGSTVNSAWMSSGWTLGGTIAFAVAGRVSDVFGRRYVLLFGQSLLIISYVGSPVTTCLSQPTHVLATDYRSHWAIPESDDRCYGHQWLWHWDGLGQLPRPR